MEITKEMLKHLAQIDNYIKRVQVAMYVNTKSIDDFDKLLNEEDVEQVAKAINVLENFYNKLR